MLCTFPAHHPDAGADSAQGCQIPREASCELTCRRESRPDHGKFACRVMASEKEYAMIVRSQRSLQGVPCLLSLLVPVLACAQTTATWDGTSGAWDEPARWSTNPAFPVNGTPAGALYHAVIPAGEVTQNVSVTLDRLTLQDGLLSQQQSDPLVVNARLIWSGGTLETASGEGGVVTGVASVSTLSGSPSFRRALLRNGGALTVADGTAAALETDFGVMTGLRNQPGGTVTIVNTGTWLGDWFGEGEVPDGLNNQGTLIKNGTGTFRAGPAPDGFNALPFQNSGTVTVNEGMLLLDATVPAAGGTWTVNAGGRIVFNESVTLPAGSTLQGAGDVEFGATALLSGAHALTGTVTIRGNTSMDHATPVTLANVMIAPSGTLQGSGAASITGNLTWEGSIAGGTTQPAVTLAAGATGTGRSDGTCALSARHFSNAGAFTWPGGTAVAAAKFDIMGNAVFTNETGATFTAAGNGTGIVTPSGTAIGTFTNSGTLEKTGAGTRTRLEWVVGNTGLVRAQSGRLELTKIVTPGGAYESRGGAELCLEIRSQFAQFFSDFSASYQVKPGGLTEFGPGILTAAAAFPDGTGTVGLRGCEVRRDTIAADLVRFQETSTRVQPPSGVLTLSAAAITGNGVIGFIAPNRVRITGALDWQSGGTALPTGSIGFTGGTLELAAGNTATLTGLGTVTGTTLQNAGTFTAAPGSTLRVTTGTIHEAGTMHFGDGTLLELRPSTSDAADATLASGTFTTSGSGAVRIFTGRNSTTTPSYATISNATVNGTIELAANLSRLRLTNGGDVKGTVRFTAAASAGQGNFTSFDIHQNATLSGVRLEDPSATQAARSVLAVTGTRTVTLGPTVECANISSILGDYFNSSTGQIIATGASTIINEGLILATGSGRSTSLAALDSFVNRGTLEARAGATVFADREFTQTAGKILLTGDGRFTMSTPSYQASTRIVTVTGGSIEGQGTFTGHLVMNGGTVSPGNGQGTLTHAGNLTLGPGSTLALDFASAAGADQLVVNGSIALTGPVQLVLAPVFHGPTATFTVLANDGADAITTTPSALFAATNELLQEGETFSAAGRTWQISYTGGDGNDVTLTLQGGGLTPLQVWRQLHFGSPDGTADAADSADFDNDGIPNLVEWALGLTPTSASLLPVSAQITAGTFEFTYTRSLAARNAGTGYIVEWSDTLATDSWSNAGVVQASLTSGVSDEIMRAVIPAGVARRFARLRITAP